MMKNIEKIIKEWKTEAKVKGIIMVSAFSNFKNTITICTDSPGPMIGWHGQLYDKYFNKLREVNHYLEKIEFVETDSWYIK